MAFGIMIFSPLKRMPSLNDICSRNNQYGKRDLASLSELFELTAVNWGHIESLIGVDSA